MRGIRYFLATPFIVIGKVLAFIVMIITDKPCVFVCVEEEIIDGEIFEFSIKEEDYPAFEEEFKNADSNEEREKIIEKYKVKGEWYEYHRIFRWR